MGTSIIWWDEAKSSWGGSGARKSTSRYVLARYLLGGSLTTLEAFQQHSVQPDDVVIFCDSNDVIFTKHSNVMLQRFLESGSKVVIGAEASCFSGDCNEVDKKSALIKRFAEAMGPEKFRAERYRYRNPRLLCTT